ncbi:MAG: hypothetical protein HZC36_12725 [Armatimonadetes bacterium]|nr:hypothetical protein [Armatimonadota bacterium]
MPASRVSSNPAAYASEATWKVNNQTRNSGRNEGEPLMNKVSEAVDLLYGVGAAPAAAFGLAPKGADSAAIHKLIEIVLRDGSVPGSLFFDWESVEGASHEVQWSATSNSATVLGSMTTAGVSEFIIGGLTPRTQYGARVRPYRGSQTAEWSDPATRVAPV